MPRDDFQRLCPNGHPANGAPCAHYKCERRATVPAPAPRETKPTPLEPHPLDLRLDKIEVIHWDGPLRDGQPPRGHK
jgi:hypothetical protein